MDKYTKLFVKASLIYLGVGVFLGTHLSIFEHGRAEIRFVHVHVMLLGFVAMLIYGVAYHILPRFNAKPVTYPGLIPFHFWLANIGVVGLSVFYILGGFWESGAPRVFFGLFGVVEAVAIAIFIINLFPVVMEEKPMKPAPVPATQSAQDPDRGPDNAAPATAPVKVSPAMKISEILEQWPHLEEVFYEHGLESVANPSARSTVGKMITLAMAARKAGKNLFELIAALEGKTLLTGKGDNGADAAVKPSASPFGGPPFDRGEIATAKTMVGRLIEVYPETKVVFEKHYGASCFTCPGQKTESVEQTAQMHSMAPQAILDEINEIIGDVLKNAGQTPISG
jgi:hypothetical protein